MAIGEWIIFPNRTGNAQWFTIDFGQALLLPNQTNANKEPMMASKSKREEKEEELDLAQMAEVIREGTRIVLPALPEPMPTRRGGELLLRLADQEEEEIALHVSFHTTPYAGAVAMMQVLKEMYNFIVNQPTPGWFGTRHPPVAVQVETGPDESAEVIWGRYAIPGTTITVDTDVASVQGIAMFALTGKCLRKDRHLAEQLFAAIRKQIAADSIYAGKAISFKVGKDNKLDLTAPDSVRFIRPDHELRDKLILNTATERAVQVEMYTPIERRADVKKRKISLNRVILLAGEYGTGKSMTGGAVAAVTAASGGTFIMLHNVKVLPQVLAFAKLCKLPHVTIFAEDIDQIIGEGERDEAKNTLLNIISGAESSTVEVMLVLTTNHINTIHPAMIRRFKAVIEYDLPDPPAVERLIRVYADNKVEGPLTESSKALAYTMPSLIQDTVESAMLSAIADGRSDILRDEDFLHVAQQIETRKRLSSRKPEPDTLAMAIQKVAAAAQQNGHSEAIEEMRKKLGDLHDRL